MAKKSNLKYWIYAAIAAIAVLALWFCTKNGMQPNECAIPAEDIGWVSIYSSGLDKTVAVTGEDEVRGLTETLNKLMPENGIEMEDEEVQLGRDTYRLEWFSRQGEQLAAVDISQTGRVYRELEVLDDGEAVKEEYCFNYIGGEVFDMEEVVGLLLKLPGE